MLLGVVVGSGRARSGVGVGSAYRDIAVPPFDRKIPLAEAGQVWRKAVDVQGVKLGELVVIVGTGTDRWGLGVVDTSAADFQTRIQSTQDEGIQEEMMQRRRWYAGGQKLRTLSSWLITAVGCSRTLVERLLALDTERKGPSAVQRSAGSIFPLVRKQLSLQNQLQV